MLLPTLGVVASALLVDLVLRPVLDVAIVQQPCSNPARK
jgi:hypothetical protein